MRFFLYLKMDITTLYQIYSEHFLVDTDTRSIRKNTIFFALKGEHFNGNQFAAKALELGASYAVVDEVEYQTQENIILVDDVLQTLQQLAHYHRKQLNIPVIGLTGSNGKTTTKELMFAVLNQKYNTIATKGNLNNHIGVPLTLLSMTPEHELAIVEMGANHQKEIEFLCSLCEPDLGYITNFGKAHLEGFGGIEGVIQGKSELYQYLRANDKLVLLNPEDDIQLEKSKGITSISVDLNNIKLIAAHPFVQLTYKNKQVQSHLIGTYNFANIAAAITLGDYFKVHPTEIIKAIEQYTPTNNRSQIIQTKNKQIILDAYNANPSSMKVALENFALQEAPHKVVILGDMFELGENSIQEHQAIVDLCQQFNFETQYFIGALFHQTQTEKQQFQTFEDFSLYLKKYPLEQCAIFIKGSRGMRLERILDLL